MIVVERDAWTRGWHTLLHTLCDVCTGKTASRIER
jgi:hypothetical protein